jgi:hypothetical protein
MTPNKQVSPVIRISRGERDASARATHLEAAFEKYSETTIERKQMSTTTNFKRIALVAVAALGLGVLTSVPSSAAINGDTVTLSAASAAQTTAETYTATSATVTVSFLPTAIGDSMTITASLTGFPATNTALPILQLLETASALVETTSMRRSVVNDTWTANTSPAVRAIAANTITTAKFAVYLQGASNAAPTVAGAYTVKITPATVGLSGAINATAVTLTINVSVAAALDTTASAATTTAYLQSGGSANSGITADSVVSGVRTAGTKAGFLWIGQKNAAGAASAESLTVAITGSGTLGFGTAGGLSTTGASGRSLLVKAADTVTIFSDGTSGKGTITVTGSVSGTLLATKTVNFYGPAASLVGSVNTAILAVGANSFAASVVAKDSAGSNMVSLIDETLYAFSSDTTIATVGTVGTYAVESATVTVTGVKAGTATITFGNASTLAASTIKSTPVTVRVGSTAVASVTVAFDKATYVPGEKATITISLKDSTGQLVVPGTYELWAATYGLNFAKGFSAGTGPATTETAVATSALTGLKTYTVYMPVTAGTVTLTGTLAKTLDADYAPVGTLKTAAAIQGTAVTASATVSDSGAAALAAVNALATTVASLRTLIVTLTNLVLKIQKKVKA